MSVGAHVFKDDRRGLWVQSNAGLTDKLTHVLPRLRAAIPNLTDIFLPPEATKTNRQQVLNAGFFHGMYAVAYGQSPEAFAAAAISRFNTQGAGFLELNFEGSAVEQMGLRTYITRAHAALRAKKPNLPVRWNVVPLKGQWIPMGILNDDPQAFLCVQNYGGNMDLLYAADDVKDELIAWGADRAKINVMHAVMCSHGIGQPRQITLPHVRNKGAFYIDDLLQEAGLLPS